MQFPLSKPGLFITATDTEVGKTVVTCAIAAVLKQRGARVGVCKPIASGCRRDREGLVSEDTEALAHFSDCPLPLATINPVRYRVPLAPCEAAEREGQPVDDEAIAFALRRIDEQADVMLVEGIGGVMVPLDEKRSVIDLAKAIDYPVVVVTRGDLGTLNHTALTCAAIRQAGLRLAGIVINRYHTDTTDLAETTNPRWLARQNRTQILATLPDAEGVAPEKAKLPASVIEATGMCNWLDIARPQRVR
ncbi:dethiobiotin synthase [Planctomycetales bacterium ZRK34]|nr:dethiobiotin synthase [Planctomycetales bacterium ZRK34]